MRRVVQFAAAETLPEAADVLRRQGFPKGAEPSERVRELLNSAMELHVALAAPQGVFEEIEHVEFARVYFGQGRNSPESPLAGIFPLAESLALFAATIGPAASARPGELFRSGELALGVMLDSVVGEAADRLAGLLAEQYAGILGHQGRATSDTRVLHYAPGYCGWDVSGQSELFARLRPQEIGVTLNESFLMQPLKSVSGVLIAAPARAHCFRPAFSFCVECKERECTERMVFAMRRKHGSQHSGV